MPSQRTGDEDAACHVAWAQQVARSVDRDDRLAAEDVEAFFERVHVRVNRPARCELAHAEAGVDRARRVIDQRDAAVAFAVPVVGQVRAEGALVKASEIMHVTGSWFVVGGSWSVELPTANH